ncbi:BZIP domain-containing protein [Favolaschia claudopus]|uniref:BZIP domain-containing protein n=1 Tax=Favolaschia claudopus TaxID=2862362 RepID=A0AAW0CYW3_9AGAR
MSALPGNPLPDPQQEKPERSRNAKAQARHRAKRKAYIEELEETVTKLQGALSQFNLEHTMSVLPPSLAKIKELEQENARLQKQNDELHRMLAETGRRPLPYELSGGTAAAGQRRGCDSPNDGQGREYKRRKMDMSNGSGPSSVVEEVYLSRPSSAHDHHHNGNLVLPRPPPLTVPDGPHMPHPHHAYPDSVPTHHSSTAAPSYAPPPPIDPALQGHSGSANLTSLHPLSVPVGGPPVSGTTTPVTASSATTNGSAGGLHLGQDGDAPGGGRAYDVVRDHHEAGYTLPPFKFTGLVQGHGQHPGHAHAEPDSWRPYAESERGP